MRPLGRDLTDPLTEWLPRQRWFAGKDRAIGEVTIGADTELAPGEPGLRHVVLDVRQGTDVDRYQLLVGIRHDLPDRLRDGAIGQTSDGAHLYDAANDPELTRVLLAGMADEIRAGALRFHRAPGTELRRDLAGVPGSAEQSNTSLIFGDSYICKLFRRLSPGVNPDLEVNLALTRAGCAHVAAVRGWIDLEPDGGEPVTLGLLSEYLRTATDGWQLAITSVRDWLAHAGPGGVGRYPGGGPAPAGTPDVGVPAPPARRGDLGVPWRDGVPGGAEEAEPDVLDPGAAGGDFAAEAERLGAATAAVHRDLAVAFGVTPAPAGEVRAMAHRMHRQLAEVSAAVPQLAVYTEVIGRAFDELAEEAVDLPLQRVHGDYHLGQVMRAETGWVLLDFEGEPARVPAERREMAHPLRDVAGMLRSFEYAARFLPAGDSRLSAEASHGLELRARAWADRNRDAFCRGYAEAGGADPAANAVLVRALELDKAVYEIRYEARNRPSWLPVPLRSLAHLAPR
ncbi:phosphotransferase [Actinomadura viridis]|uniref:Maltokinase n=1 Tax=Actinomadura viridis TaxID=58110 RepID=A0A931DF22_9ACTN|nr:aminoglycoside phosphotransferase [Actinomadura viridis]MBG6087624.1 maltokinase [Actinomadura viridis]